MGKRSGRKGKGRAQGGPSRSQTREMVKAITDLKIATAVHPTPRIVDVPRILMRGPKKYTVVNNFFWGNIVTSTSSVTSGAVYVTLSSLPQTSSFATIFDSWRVLQFTVRFVPSLSMLTAVANPPLLTVIDYDDATAPTTTGALRAYDTLLVTPFGQAGGYVERTVNPKIAIAAFSGAFTSYAQASKWVDCASPGIQWYGVKYAIDMTAGSYNPAYDIEVDAVMQFKSVR